MLLDLASQRLGLTLEYDPALVRGTELTLRTAGPLTDSELWDLTNAALASRGLTTIRVPGSAVLRVVKRAEAPEAARLEPMAPAEPETPAGYRSVLLRTRHLSGKEAAEALRPVLSKQGGQATPIGTGRLVLVSDLGPVLDQAERLLELVDAPGASVAIEEVPVRNLSADALVVLVAQVSAKRDAVGGAKISGDVLAGPSGDRLLLIAPPEDADYWRRLIAQLDQREPLETRTYVPRAFSARDVADLLEKTSVLGTQGPGPAQRERQPRVVVDELTGSLIVTATAAQHQQVEATMERLESVPERSRRPVRSFKIKNRAVGEVLEILQRLMEAGVLEDASPGTAGSANAPLLGGQPQASYTTPRPFAPGGGPPPGTPSATSGTAPEVSKTPDAPPHSTGGSSPPLSLTIDEGTNTLIAAGDARLLAQIEALLPSLDVRQPQVRLEAILVSLTDSQSLSLGVELERLEISGDTLIRLSSLFGLSSAAGGSRSVGDGSGFTGAVLNPGEFSVIVRALEQINAGRSLNRPSVLVNNNQTATFNSTLQQPYATVNASDTVATTSFGGTLDAGTILSVTPHIAEGDHLVLEYDVSLSSFTGAGTSTLPPPRQQNAVASTATIPDGFTVVVGGLEVETFGKAVNQVPGLGSVPLLGELFKNRSRNASRSRFYVFIRATVMRDIGFESLKYYSELAADSVGAPDGWPELEPRIIR